MTTLANNARTYATVAAIKSAPHIKDQKATGRSKGVTVTGRSTTGVRAIKPTTDRSHQETTGSPMGETKAQKMQSQSDAKTMLRKALYEIFDIKAPIVTKPENPIEVNAVCYTGKYHRYGIASQVNHMFYKNSMRPQDNGHKYAPPTNKLMRSLECFHCHKKGHYARHCQVKRRDDHDRQEVAVINAIQSRPDMGILLMDQLAKRIQENKSANSFDALKEETLDHIPLGLLDTQKIKELTTAPKHMLGPQKIKAVQEFITANAHKFDEATHARIINLCKPKTKSSAQRWKCIHAYLKSKPTIKQLGDAHAYPKLKPSAQQMGDALKKQIQTMDEDTKIRTLNTLIPKNECNIQKIETLAKSFGLDSVFVNKSNSVQVQFAVISYKRETKEIGLLDTGAMENFIDTETARKLRLGTKELPYQQPIFNVDGTPNRQGKN